MLLLVHLGAQLAAWLLSPWWGVLADAIGMERVWAGVGLGVLATVPGDIYLTAKGRLT